jgi:hypothetical protein
MMLTILIYIIGFFVVLELGLGLLAIVAALVQSADEQQERKQK